MELMNLDSMYLPVLPGVNFQVRDLRMEVKLSDCLLPTIHIEGNLDIHFPWYYDEMEEEHEYLAAVPW